MNTLLREAGRQDWKKGQGVEADRRATARERSSTRIVDVRRASAQHPAHHVSEAARYMARLKGAAVVQLVQQRARIRRTFTAHRVTSGTPTLARSCHSARWRGYAEHA